MGRQPCNGVDAACQKLNIKCYQITYPGNTPLLDYGVDMRRHITNRSIERNQAAYEFLVRNKIPLVVMVAYWGKSYRSHSSIFEKSVRDTVDQLELAGVQVVIVEDNASFNYMVPHRLARLAWLGQETTGVGISLEEHYEYNRIPREVFHSLSNRNVRVYDPTPYFAGDSNVWPAEIDDMSMIRDKHHLSEAGAIGESMPQIAIESEKQFH
ncbi:SGNH hydrolase domain-containing protein [Planctomycetaceae bacterium]|nr:SGNH hydrolase domain-containing protein [Planctomycetaceae bacterium]